MKECSARTRYSTSGSWSWLNGEHLRLKPVSELLRAALKLWIDAGWITAQDADARRSSLLRAVSLMQPRIQTVRDFLNFEYFFNDPQSYEEKARKKHWKVDSPSRLELLIARLEALSDFSEREIEGATRTLSGQLGISTGKLIHPTRLALSGTNVGTGTVRNDGCSGTGNVYPADEDGPGTTGTKGDRSPDRPTIGKTQIWLPPRLMARHAALDRSIGVRIPGGQPNFVFKRDRCIGYPFPSAWKNEKTGN